MTTPLPPQGSRESDDKLPGEAELAALYRKLPQQEPDTALDDTVRRMAAAAVSSRPPQRRARWPVALGTAATLVLAAGLGWRMRGMPSNPPAPPPSAPVATAPRAAREATLPAPAIAGAPRQIAPAAVARASLQQAQAIAPARMALKARSNQSAHVEPAAPAAEPAPAPPAAAVEGKLAAPAPAVAETSAERDAGAAMVDRINPAAPAAPSNLPASMPAAATVADGAARPAAKAGPAQELEAIRRLFAQGRSDEARQRLRAFHRAHPHWALPDALRRELREP